MLGKPKPNACAQVMTQNAKSLTQQTARRPHLLNAFEYRLHILQVLWEQKEQHGRVSAVSKGELGKAGKKTAHDQNAKLLTQQVASTPHLYHEFEYH